MVFNSGSSIDEEATHGFLITYKFYVFYLKNSLKYIVAVDSFFFYRLEFLMCVVQTLNSYSVINVKRLGDEWTKLKRTNFVPP